MSITYIDLDNDYEFEFDIKRKATTTGTLEAAATLSGLTAHFSLTDGGAAIATTSTTLTERSAKAGRYFGILATATLNAALSAGQRVYPVLTGATVEKSGEVDATYIVRGTGRST